MTEVFTLGGHSTLTMTHVRRMENLQHQIHLVIILPVEASAADALYSQSVHDHWATFV